MYMYYEVDMLNVFTSGKVSVNSANELVHPKPICFSVQRGQYGF